MRSARDKAIRLTGASSPGMRRRQYFDDGGAAGESGNAGAAGAGEAGPLVVPPPPAPPPSASASDLKALDDKLTAGLGSGTPYTPIDKPKLPGIMRRGGRS